MKKYFYKLALVMSFLFITGFRGCPFFVSIFSLENYFAPAYNAVTFYEDYYYYAANGGIIYIGDGSQDIFVIDYTVPGNPDLFDIHAILTIPIICVGENGTIVKYIDPDWQVKNSTVNVNLNKILTFYSDISYDDLVFVVGNEGTVLKSTDFGETWVKLNFPTSDNLYDITENNGTIFVSGENYSFFASTDDGDNWFPVGPSNVHVPEFGPFSSYNKIYFYDENIGYVGGPNGLILKTTDGGVTWETQVASGFDEVNDLYFISTDSGAAVGPNGVVRLTTDGGETWFEDDSLTSFLNGETIKRIVPFGIYYGMVIGENGFDMFVAADSTYLDSLIIVTDVEDEPQIVEDFHLYQNYPNPFNPSTNIRFRIVERGFVNLKVFDLLGNEITTLVNEEKQTGEYEVEFNASNLPSGIYFYRLKSGEFSTTKKLVLIK